MFVGKAVAWLAARTIAGLALYGLTAVLMGFLEDSLKVKRMYAWSDKALEAFINHHVVRLFGHGLRRGPLPQWLFPVICGPIFFTAALVLVFGEILFVHPFRAWRLAHEAHDEQHDAT